MGRKALACLVPQALRFLAIAPRSGHHPEIERRSGPSLDRIRVPVNRLKTPLRGRGIVPHEIQEGHIEGSVRPGELPIEGLRSVKSTQVPFEVRELEKGPRLSVGRAIDLENRRGGLEVRARHRPFTQFPSDESSNQEGLGFLESVSSLAGEGDSLFDAPYRLVEAASHHLFPRLLELPRCPRLELLQSLRFLEVLANRDFGVLPVREGEYPKPPARRRNRIAPNRDRRGLSK